MKGLAPAPRSDVAGARVVSSRTPPAQSARLPDVMAGRALVRDVLHAQGIQPQVRVGATDDPSEREADAVAERVLQNRPAPVPGGASAVPSSSAELSRKATRPEDEDPKVRRKAKTEDEDPKVRRKERQEDDERKIRRKAKRDDEEQKVRRKERREDEEQKVRRKEVPDDDDREIQLKAASEATPAARSSFSSVASRALAAKDSGSPLLGATRSRLESNMGVDLGKVRVHERSADREAADALSARAFTHQNDIWLGSGESQHDVRLMAHEAAHVVQQAGAPERAVVRRDPDVTDVAPAAPTDVDNGASPAIYLPTLEVPTHKEGAHRAKLSTLNRRAGYVRGQPRQSRVWENNVASANAETKLKNTLGFLDDHTYRITGPDNIDLLGGAAALARRLRRPFWRVGGGVAERHEVDHMVELQVSGWPDGTASWANEVLNMEMLNRSANGESGRTIQQRSETAVKDFMRDPTKNAQLAPEYRLPPGTTAAGEVQTAARRALRHYAVKFRDVTPFALENPVSTYSKTDIEAGTHIDGLLHKPPDIHIYDMLNRAGGGVFDAHNFSDEAIIGSASNFVVYYKEYGGGKAQFPWTNPSETSRAAAGADQHAIRGMRISNIEFRPRQDPIGVVTGRFFTRQQQYVQDASNEPYHWQVRRFPGTDFAGYLDPEGFDSWIRARFRSPQFSPIEFDDAGMSEESGSVRVAGHIQSSLPILRDVALDIVVEGDDLRVEKTFSTGEFSIPGPIQVTDSSLTLSIGTESGLGIAGEVLFQIPSVGSGRLSGAAGTGTGEGPSFALEGEFNVERGPFDPARVVARYRDGQFSGEGDLGIRAGTVPGVQSASIHAALDESGFSATGVAQLAIPGVQQGTLNVSYSEAAGLSIGGGFQLANNIPGIESGSVEAQLRERPDGSGWAVSARGSARPRIPGVSSELSVAYDDGALTAQATASYARGMLSGSLVVGATNRVIDETGHPTDALGTELHAFGSGTLTVRLTPWLEGTVGVRILPNAELELMGEIGLPGTLEIFPRRQIERSLLNIAVQVPIIPGVVAEIGGGLTAQAGFGPGVIDELRVGITYNPSHEGNTHITGDAHLNIPADAGLRLAVRAGIGLGITGASATGGLEIGGLLGIAGAAEAGVHIDWTPHTGLVIDAFGALHAEPKFRFDISGYVSVRALGFEIYGKRWELAAFEYGSDLRLGVRFPIHYQEGQPFEIDLSRVEFEVPEIQPRQLLDGLIDRIK